MPLFFDSNVIVGFCFPITDKWGPAAAAVMSTSDTKYTSNSVMEECFGDGDGGKTETVLRKLRRQINKFRTYCNRPDCELYSKQFSEQFPLIAKRIHMFKEQGKNKNEMSDTLLDEVEQAYYQSKIRLKQLNLHKRTEGYDELYHQLESEFSNDGVKLDQDDLEIILDAHDLALTVEGVILVTGDLKHIVAAESTIRRNTKIHDVQYLEKYTPS